MPAETIITDSARPATEEEIGRLESETGVTLPAEYRAFLLRHNGGKPSRRRFTTRDQKVESHATRLFPVDENDEGGLQSEIEGITGCNLIPREMIPIGIDPGEDRVVLAVGGPDVGRVFYWAWGEEPDPPTCSRKYMRIIADSFDEFLASLRD
jgi:hypothetical protein